MKTDFSNLPKHWKVKKLKEVVVKQTGTKPIHRFSKKTEDNMPEWDVDALSSGKVSQFADWYSTIHCFETDILVILSGGRNGFVFKSKNGIAGRALFCLTPLNIDTNYLFYYLKYREFEHSDSRNLKPSFWEMEIPIPPIEEQKHIVHSIQQTYQDFEAQNQEAEQKLLEALKKLVPIQSETLDNIIGLEDFKNAVLDLAVSGKLTKKWREQNKCTEIVINKKIEADLGTFKNVTLPDEWLLEAIGNVATFQQGVQISKTKRYKQPSENRLPLLRIKNYTNKFTEDIEYVEIDEEMLIASEQDIIMVRTGETRGTILTGVKGIFHNNTFRINYDSDVFERKYLFFLLKSAFIQQFILSKTLKGTVPDLSHEIFEKCPVPITCKQEQTEIVNVVETIFTEADKIQQDYELQKKQQDDLLKSIIHSFFQYSSFPPLTSDWDLDAQIKEAREKKEKEIKLLKEKQMAKRKEEEAKPKQDILSLLEEAGKPMSANELLENSKFNGNIDEFLAEAKRLADEGLVKDSFLKGTEGTETPLSMLSLIQ